MGASGFFDNFFIVCKYPLLFGSFLGCFSFKALDLGDFRGISKNKICGKGRGGCGAAGLFLGDEGEEFLLFFHAFFVDVEGWRAKNIFCKPAKKKFA